MPKVSNLLSSLSPLVIVPIAASGLILAGPGAAAAEDIEVVERATTDAVTDTGAKGDSAGDILTFANEVFDAEDKNKIGTNQGVCFRTVVGKAWECFWTVSLEKGQITVVKTINGEPREAVSHKMDHVKAFANPNEAGKEYTLALEIECNNKDPFFDRDLENFKRLHADGAISVGIIVTRGRSLHAKMRELVARFVEERNIETLDDLLRWGYNPTARQRNAIAKRVERAQNPISFSQSFVAQFVSDKFGEATTHWRKLEDRVNRGVGNPCPLVLIGLPDSIVSFDEDETTVREIIASAHTDDSPGEPETD